MITQTGYTRRTYQEILDGKILRAREFFGEDIDTSDLTPLGKFIRINAYEQAETEEIAEAIYYSIFPNTATGASLDRLCAFANITRNLATPSRYIVVVEGEPNVEIPFGFLFGTDAGIQFYNITQGAFGEDGTCEIVVECTTAGTIGNVNSTDISVIVNPDASVKSVLGKSCVTLGTDDESDTALRNRFAAARTGLGSCNESSIAAALMRVPSVTSAAVISNETDSIDEDGRPPHSFECYITGGEDYHQQIAETIFAKKPIGIKTHGNVAVEYQDGSGKEHIVNFSHTRKVEVTVSVEIITDANYEAENGKAKIISNLQEHINGLGVGKSVILSALYGKVHSVTGVVEVTRILLNGAESNVDINVYSSAQCSNVSVTEDTR